MRRLVVVALVVGCGGKQPESGTWSFESVEVSEDTCNAGDQVEDPDGEFYLRNNEDKTFTVDPNDGSDVFDCTWKRGSFDCPSRLSDELVGASYAVSVRALATGEIGEESGTGTQVGTLDCEGSGCAALESAFETSFPCSVTWDFEIARTGDDLGPEL